MTTNVTDSKIQFHNLNQELIDLCKAGSQKAQFQIYKLYYKSMYNTSLRIVNNQMEAEDIMQESFLSAFEKIDAYSGDVSFGAWLKKIVINRSLDLLRIKKREIFDELYSTPDSDESIYKETGTAEDSNLKVQEVIDAINELPDGCRIVITLFLLEGYDHEEIAEVLSISPMTSRSQFSRGRRRIIERLRRTA